MPLEKLTREQLIKAIYLYEHMTEDAGWHHRMCEDCGEVTDRFWICCICCEMACEICNNRKLVQTEKGKLCEKCLAEEK